MAKFDINRMGNSTIIGRVDNQHNALEAAVEDVFGIPDNTEITAYIFGVNPQTGGKPIQPDGSIRGVPVLKSDGIQSDAATAVGFKFDDGTVAKLLVFVDSELQVFKDDDYPNEDWVKVSSVEVPGTGKLTALTDYNGVTDLSAQSGKLLKCDGNGWDLADPTAGVGVTTFTGLTDGPGDYGTAGQILKSTGSAIDWDDAPSIAAPLVLFLGISQSSAGWGKDTWIALWGWALTDPEGSGYVETDSKYITDDDPVFSPNKFITELPPGPYEVSVWYTTTAGTEKLQGTREWRVSGTSLYGPAVVGVQQRATVGFTSATIPEPIDGAKYLGTRMLLVGTLTTDMVIEVKQTAGSKIGTSTEVGFYAVIRRVQ